VQNEFSTNTLPNRAATPVGGAWVKPTPVENVVGFLSFSRDHRDRVNAIETFSRREWNHVLQWLDDAGLAFYFLQRLKDTHAGDVVPPVVLSRLERNFASNQLRVDDMSHRFDAINKSFDHAGVQYVVIKGFSLVPQFCPYAPLRHQADLDYLVDEQSLPPACRGLIDVGYSSQKSPSSKDSIFIIPGGSASRGDDQYSPQAPHAVELHTDIMDSKMLGLPPIPSLFSVAQARTRHWNGFAFPAQADENAFLLQVLHACNHFFGQWIRMSCLFEIAYFLHRRTSDTELWRGIEQRVGDSAVLREFVVIVTEVAAQLFAVPLPKLVQSWSTTIRPGPRTWIEYYARNWALCDLPRYEFNLFPSAKLALFLHHQYRSASWDLQSRHQKESLCSRLSRVASSIKSDPSLVLNAGWWRRQRLIRRTFYYASAGLRYVCEIPRWRWRNRALRQTATAASIPWTGDSLPSKKAS
jgi:hypothetical protein